MALAGELQAKFDLFGEEVGIFKSAAKVVEDARNGFDVLRLDLLLNIGFLL